MTLTDTIADELLEAVNRPGGLDEITAKYAHSKGPLYGALARATGTLAQRLAATRDELKAAEEAQAARQKQVNEMDGQATELGKKRDGLAREVKELERSRERQRKSLTHVAGLKALGFGEKEFERLAQLLGKIAASQGEPPGEGVSQFFRLVGRYEGIISLELETQRAQVAASKAKAEAERWEAEARRKEATTKARLSSIDTVERLLAKGVKEGDLPAWEAVPAEAGRTPETLAAILSHYATLDGLCQERQQRVEQLAAQTAEADARLQALMGQETQVKAAIASVRDSAVREVELTGRQIAERLGELKAKAMEYCELERQAGELEEWITLARAFRDRDRKLWERTPTAIIEQLLLGLVHWAGGQQGCVQPVPPPDLVRQRCNLWPYEKASFTDLIVWAASCIDSMPSPTAPKALPSGSK